MHMEHNGYTIKVSIWPDTFGGTFYAEYSVHSGGIIILKGTGPGGFTHIGDAEREGYKAARLRLEEPVLRIAETLEREGHKVARMRI